MQREGLQEMIDDPFRKVLPKYTDRIVAIYRFLGLTPNHITVAALILALASAALVLDKRFGLAAVVWWLGRLLDGTDGIYARKTSQTSLFGAFLDIVCDMAAYSVMVVALANTFPEFGPWWHATLFLYVLCITSALALGNLEAQRKIPARDDRGLRLAAGLAEGGETGLAYTIFLIFPGVLKYTLPGWVFILAITVIARTLLAKRELS